MTAARTPRTRLGFLLVRGGWRRRSTASVAIAAIVGAAASAPRRSPGLTLVGGTSLALVAFTVAAASAAARSTRMIRNPPARNELPPEVSTALPDEDALATWRNPTAWLSGDAEVPIPARLDTVDFESTDGTFDRRLGQSASFSYVRARDFAGGNLTPRDVRVAQQQTDLTSLAGAIWLIPSARYHIHELGPLATELAGRGVNARIVCVSPPSAGVRNEMSKWVAEYSVVDDPREIHKLQPRAIMLMSDWGPYAPWIAAAKDAGIKTFAKVEGAQDFSNRDTMRRVLPYSAADVVLCQGEYDLRSVGSRGAVVGSSRLESLLALSSLGLAEPTTRNLVVANYNFSYGTREYAAERWLGTVRRATQSAGRDLRVSLHPAVTRPQDAQICEYPLAFELERAGAFLSRASTAVFDAVALGTRVAYVNPHRERCWIDLEFDSAVPEIRRERELARWLASDAKPSEARAWLRATFLSVGQTSCESRTADLLLRET